MKIFDDFIVSIGFHAVGNASTGYKEMDDLFLKEEDFEFYIKTLYKNGYKTITFSELSKWFNGEADFDFKPVIITFDDGYKSVLNAEKIMKKHGFKGNVFIITDYIGKKSNGFPWENKNPAILDMLNEEDIKYLLKEGWEIGSHTVSHRLLNDLHKKEIEKELIISKKILEDTLKKDIIAFAYPKGKLFNGISSGSITVASKVYKIAFSVESGVIFKDSLKFLLKRIIINKYTDKRNFLKKISYNFLKEIGKVPEERYTVFYNMASELKRRGDIKNAEIIFNHLLKLYPPSDNINIISGVLFHLGEINLLKKKTKLSKEYFRKAHLLNMHKKATAYIKDLK